MKAGANIEKSVDHILCLTYIASGTSVSVNSHHSLTHFSRGQIIISINSAFKPLCFLSSIRYICDDSYLRKYFISSILNGLVRSIWNAYFVFLQHSDSFVGFCPGQFLKMTQISRQCLSWHCEDVLALEAQHQCYQIASKCISNVPRASTQRLNNRFILFHI